MREETILAAGGPFAFGARRMGDRDIQLERAPRRIEYRAFEAASDAAGGFDGYASTFWDIDSYGTAFAPGAFAKTIAERADRTLVLWQHDPYQPIGKPIAMEEDARGLAVSARITDGTAAGREALALLRDGVPLGLSVGFRTLRERPVDLERDPIVLDNAPSAIRANPEKAVIIEEARLFEFSVVSFPANEQAQVSAIRQDVAVEGLVIALADLREGRLSPAARELVADLAAAWRDAPDGPRPAPRSAKAPRRVDAEVVMARWGHYIRTVEG